MGRAAAALTTIAAAAAGAPSALGALPIPTDALAATCAAGTYVVEFAPGRRAQVRTRAATLASATLRRRSLAGRCRRIPVLPRASLDDAFLSAPRYVRATIRCRLPERPDVEVHRLRRDPLGSGLTISIDGHLVVAVVLRPQGSSMRTAALFCRRAG